MTMSAPIPEPKPYWPTECDNITHCNWNSSREKWECIGRKKREAKPEESSEAQLDENGRCRLFL